MWDRLSALFRWFEVQPVPVVDTTTTTGGQGLARGKKQRKPKAKKETKFYQAAMYAASLDTPAARAWKQEPARRCISPGPTIEQLLAKDAEVIDRYEQEGVHVDYLAIRSTNKPEYDTCSACYFEEYSKIVPTKIKNLDKHFELRHKGPARERCSACTTMLYTQHLKWHTKYCHPGMAVKEVLG